MQRLLLIIAALALLAVTGCGGATRDDANVWTLYRASAVSGDPITRYQVATFDAPDPAPYNKQNCEMIATLWKESGAQIRYWCEQGHFHL